MKPCTDKSERIQILHDYYLANSPMVVHRELVPWHCQRSLLLYAQGWLQSGGMPTVRLRRAGAEAYLLTMMKPVIIAGEQIVGQPDYSLLSSDEQRCFDELKQTVIPSLPAKRGRADHLALDYPTLLSLGIEGLIAKVEGLLRQFDPYDGQTIETIELYEGILTELRALLVLEKHYTEAAYALAEKSDGEEKEDFLKLAKTLERVPAKQAETFREALQSVHFFLFSLFGIYSAGRPDQYLLPYYRHDIENGIMNEYEAQELVDGFCLQYMNNMSAWAAAGFMLGGRDKNGKAVENELTWHFLAAIAHTHTPDPNVGFCVTDETSREILSFAVGLIREGHGNPQIWNNDAVTASMRQNGYDDAISNLFTHSTCVEITPIGCSGVSITSPYINMLKIFVETFMQCDDNIDFDGLFALYAEKFDAYCRNALKQEAYWQLERSRNSTDPLRISALIDDCLSRGRSNDAGGARYNYLEPNMLGMTNTIESFNVLHELVYVRHELTVAAFRKILAENYDGHEELRQEIIHQLPHFGMCTPFTNELAKKLTDMVIETFGRFTTFRGATVIPGAFSYRDHESNGRMTGASPDGRLAGATLADGSSPVQGYDRLGPTLSLCSTAAWEPARFLGGTAVNIKMNGNTDSDTIIQFIRGFLRTKTAQVQFNIVDADVLLDAQKNPDRYGDLIVRIGGYSDYFTRIPKRLQDDVISRSRN